MTRLSSRLTFFNKRVFPVIWFGTLGCFFVVAVRTHVPLPMYGVFLMLTFIGYAIFRALLSDLMDEVYDNGDRLLVRNGGQEDFILLTQVKNISASVVTNPQRITLSLRTPCRFGNQVSFMPKSAGLFRVFSVHPLVNELIDRVDKARGR